MGDRREGDHFHDGAWYELICSQGNIEGDTASLRKRATNAPIAPPVGNASERTQRPQRGTRQKPAKPVGAVAAENGDI